MRTWQVYLAKLPLAVVEEVPALRELTRALPSAGVDTPESLDETDAAFREAADKSASTRRRRPASSARGQGFAVDQAAKVAIEAHAMNAAIAHFSSCHEVADVHATESYDLACTHEGGVKHVEVKGTTTSGAEVLLTPNEVLHAQRHPDMALFVLTEVVLDVFAAGNVQASGGQAFVIDPWVIAPSDLRPVGYRKAVPGK